MILVSVVVPTYHRDELLDRCLFALVHQDFDPSYYEIIVVDDGSSAATHRVVERWMAQTTVYGLSSEPVQQLAGGRSDQAVQRRNGYFAQAVFEPVNLPPVRYLAVNPNRHGPAIARNIGWRAAQGSVIAFTDDDTIPQPDWLKNGFEALSGGAAGASGQVIVPLGDDPTDYELNARGLEKSEFVTANCFYQKRWLEAAGGFDEQFRTAWREDTDLYFTLHEMGCLLVKAPLAVVIHPVRPARWGVSLLQQRKNVDNALLYKKHPRLYRKKLQNIPPIRYYAVLTALAAVLLGWVLGVPAVSSAAAALWAGMVLLFCLKRLQRTSRSPSHIFEMAVTSILIPPLAVYWRIRGALRYRVLFL